MLIGFSETNADTHKTQKEYCPFCGEPLKRGKLFDGWQCAVCMVSFSIREFECYKMGVLPEEFQLENQDSIRLDDSNPAMFIISLFFSILLLVFFLSTGNMYCLLFLLLTSFIFIASMRKIELFRANGDLFIFSGLGNLGFRKTICCQEILFAAARVGIGNKKMTGKVEIEFRGGKKYVFAHGVTPLRALYLADWINGRSFFKEGSEPDTDLQSNG